MSYRCDESEEYILDFFREFMLGGNEQKKIWKVAEEHDF